jgi:hypothetical protein
LRLVGLVVAEDLSFASKNQSKSSLSPKPTSYLPTIYDCTINTNSTRLTFFSYAMTCDKTRYFGIFWDILGYFGITVAADPSSDSKKQSETSLSLPPQKIRDLTNSRQSTPIFFK